jgi:UDP-4-amino-4,6-dideoxy-N-acetyl-beta-L-altrosamine transaminase/dTDP-4-dehydrorhamnose reductase
MKRILFTGGSSLLAQCWVRDEDFESDYVLGLNVTKLSTYSKKTIDLNYQDTSVLKEQLAHLKIEVLINCIGLTNVEACDLDPDKAYKANVIVPKVLSKICAELDIKFVHISTDHLFGGNEAFSSEKKTISPVNQYGITKGQGEQAVVSSNRNALIIRTNFFGWGPNHRDSFSDTILKNLENKKISHLFEDVFFTPILVSELKKQLFYLLEINATGVFNICSSERVSKFQFGQLLAIEFGYEMNLIHPISFNDKPELITRPQEMSLSNHKLSFFTNKTIASLKEQIKYLREHQKNKVQSLSIPYGRQDVSESDINAVVDVLRSDFLTQGPTIEKFERSVAEYTGASYAYACNSATSALHVACLALGVGKGDLVWTSPISFVASSNCALYCNADVDFVDIDEKTYNMSVIALEKKLIRAKEKGRLPKVVIPVHLAGQSCEMEQIQALSKVYGFKIIEDASHGIGATYKGAPVGNCKYSDIAVFSFHPVKIITTCEGGMCLTNDPNLSNLIGRYRSHGITRQASEMSKTPDGPWYYEQLNLGYNYRMNDVQAALGLSQMSRLGEFVEKRRAIAKRYDQLLGHSILQIPLQHFETSSSWHLYIIRLKKNSQITHKQLFEKFRTAGILVNIHYIPIYRQPYYQQLGFTKEGFEASERYYEEAISIPIFPGLTEKNQDQIVSLIKQPVGFQNLF